MENMVSITRLELTPTQLMVLREAWDAVDPARFSQWTDDFDKPIDEDFFVGIDNILESAEFHFYVKGAN